MSQQEFTITVPREKAAKISERIYEDIDKGLITAHIDASPAGESISIHVVIKSLLNSSVIKKPLDVLLKDLNFNVAS